MTEYYYEPAEVRPGDADDPEVASLAEWTDQWIPPLREGDVHERRYHTIVYRVADLFPRIAAAARRFAIAAR